MLGAAHLLVQLAVGSRTLFWLVLAFGYQLPVHLQVCVWGRGWWLGKAGGGVEGVLSMARMQKFLQCRRQVGHVGAQTPASCRSALHNPQLGARAVPVLDVHRHEAVKPKLVAIPAREASTLCCACGAKCML